MCPITRHGKVHPRKFSKWKKSEWTPANNGCNRYIKGTTIIKRIFDNVSRHCFAFFLPPNISEILQNPWLDRGSITTFSVSEITWWFNSKWIKLDILFYTWGFQIQILSIVISLHVVVHPISPWFKTNLHYYNWMSSKPFWIALELNINIM